MTECGICGCATDIKQTEKDIVIVDGILYHYFCLYRAINKYKNEKITKRY